MILAIAASVAVFTASDARVIQRKCHSPPSWIVAKRDGTFQFKPAPNGDNRKVECVLAEMKAIAEKRRYRVGVIGNEMPEPEKHPTSGK
jgi:hypothetical protein